MLVGDTLQTYHCGYLSPIHVLLRPSIKCVMMIQLYLPHKTVKQAQDKDTYIWNDKCENVTNELKMNVCLNVDSAMSVVIRERGSYDAT